MKFFRMQTSRVPGSIGFITGILGLLILFRDLVGRDIATTLWADGFDPNLIYWMLEWGYHKLIIKSDWVNFWNANQFYPHANSLAYSESLLTLQVFYGPLRLMGLLPLEALYATLAIYTLIACALSDYALVKIGGFSWYERALIVYTAHFSMAITNFLSHYQLFAFEMAAPFLLFYFLFLRDLKGGYLVILSAIFSFAVGFSTYFAPLVGTVCLILLLAFFSQIKESIQFGGISRSIKYAATKVGHKYILISTLILALLYLIQLDPYLKLFRGLPPQDWNETLIYSAKAWSFFTQASTNSLFYPTFKFANGYWEYSYFPGAILLTLSIFGCVLSIKGICIQHRGDKFAITSNYELLNKFLTILFFVAVILSLGPLVHGIYMPFALFAKLIPGFESIRTPGRFGMLLGLPLGIFTVYAIRFFYIQSLQKLFHVKIFVYFISTLILISIDGALSIKIFPFSIPNKDFYLEVRNKIREHEPLAILPLVKKDHFETIMNYMDHLKGSTIHHGWIISGYGSRSTSELNELADLDRQFQDGNIQFEEILQKIKSLGISKIIVFPEDYALPARERIIKYIDLDKKNSIQQCFLNGCIFEIK